MNRITFTDENNNPIEELTQWNVNNTLYIHGLELSEPPFVHFANRKSETALPVESTIEGDAIVAPIPNILLQQDLQLLVYIYEYAKDTYVGKTTHIYEIPIRSKIRPDDYLFEENIKGINALVLDYNIRKLQEEQKQTNLSIGSINASITKLQNDLNDMNTQYSSDIQSLQSTDTQIQEQIQKISDDITVLQDVVKVATTDETVEYLEL